MPVTGCAPSVAEPALRLKSSRRLITRSDGSLRQQLCYFEMVAILVHFCGTGRVRNIKSATICLTLACVLTIPARATTVIVSNTNDNGPGSLRQALADANDGDTIDAMRISGVITLTTGQLLVDKSE